MLKYTGSCSIKGVPMTTMTDTEKLETLVRRTVEKKLDIDKLANKVVALGLLSKEEADKIVSSMKQEMKEGS